MPANTISENCSFIQSPILLPIEKQIKNYRGIKGWVFAHILNQAFETLQADGTRLYFDKKNLVKHLFTAPEGRHNPSQLKQDACIQQLVLESLNPVIGKSITVTNVEELCKYFKDKVTAQLAKTNSNENAKAIVREHLESFKVRHLQVMEYAPQEIEKLLQPGDILCRKYDDGAHSNVVMGQSFQKLWMRSPREREGYKISHLAIYVGNGKVAEAVWPHEHKDEIRIVDLANPQFALNEATPYRYIVCRAKNQNLAKEAAEVAKFIATDTGSDHKHPVASEVQYSKIRAILSVLHPANFGLLGKYRYLKQYLDYKNGQKPHTFLKHTDLFCSYFVGLCYQTAESQSLCPKILGPDNKPPRSFTRTKIGDAIQRGLWARIERWKHLTDLNKAVQMRFDARRMSPQYFRNFSIRHPELFQDVFLFKSSTES